MTRQVIKGFLYIKNGVPQSTFHIYEGNYYGRDAAKATLTDTD